MTELEDVAAVVHDYPLRVAQYRDGDVKWFGYLFGIVMQRSSGEADPRVVNVELWRQLEQLVEA